MPPTALKMMRQVRSPQDRYDSKCGAIGSGGETLGEELLDWGRRVMGLDINEFYGQTEVNLVVGNCCRDHENQARIHGQSHPRAHGGGGR